MAMIRAFIALDLDPNVLGKIEQVSRQLKQKLTGVPIKWVPVANIHLTLKFLGDVSEGNLPVLYEILKTEAVRQSVFEVNSAGLGAFPSANRPRVVWVGVNAPSGLVELQRNIDLGTARLGYAAEERGFSPHLTLGRVSRNATPEDIRRIGEVLNEVKVGALGVSRIQAVHFYRSDLSQDGATYTRLFTAQLQV